MHMQRLILLAITSDVKYISFTYRQAVSDAEYHNNNKTRNDKHNGTSVHDKGINHSQKI